MKIVDLAKVAELTFIFPHNTDWNQLVHVYLVEKWEGIPSESEETRPKWFDVDVFPYDLMWPTDEFWLPIVLNGKQVQGRFVFGEGDSIQEKEVEVVTMF